jgi:hypothetical protein
MTSNAERFASLCLELKALLQSYMEHTEDGEEHQAIHYGMYNLLISIEILELYSHNDPNARELLQSLSENHARVLVKQIKH